MILDAQPITVQLLDRLRHNRSALPWHDRVKVGELLRQRLAGGATAEAVELAHLLARDPKHEVRYTVALVLPMLPETDYRGIHARLVQDPNACVSAAARRAAGQRAKAAKTVRARKIGFDRIQEDLKAIERRHGKAAARAAMHLADKSTELLVGSMVHDLRSVIGHLHQNADLMAFQTPDADGRRFDDLLRRVREDSRFLEMTIADMEKFTAGLTGPRQLENLRDMVLGAVEQAQTSVRRDRQVDPAEIQVEIDIPFWHASVVRRPLVVAALVNVIKNAMEAFAIRRRDVAPAIKITSTLEGAWFRLRVTDNGMGLSREEVTAIMPFIPGRRNKFKRNSTGYGLPNAIRNLRDQGGELDIQSQEDQGTTVTVSLPLPPQNRGEA